MVKILQKEEKVLRKVAKEVPLADISSPKFQKLLKDMRTALKGEYDGVGIAAPQIGESLRVFIVSDIVFKARKKLEKAGAKTTPTEAEIQDAETNDDPTEVGDEDTEDAFVQDFQQQDKLVYINPEIISMSKDKKALEEGCLSVRPLFGKVKRATRVKIRAYDENGQLFERGASGLLAQIYQHEVDHLNGTLFIDKAKDVREMPLDQQIPQE